MVNVKVYLVHYTSDMQYNEIQFVSFLHSAQSTVLNGTASTEQYGIP